MYILKIKGKIKIPDYIQIRDSRFTLLAYCRADRPDDALKKIGLEKESEQIKKIIAALPYGKVTVLDV